MRRPSRSLALLSLALALTTSASARAQNPPQLPPPPPPNSTPQYEPPPPPSQTTPSPGPQPRTPPRREKPDHPEPPREPPPPPRRAPAPPVERERVERVEPVDRDEAPRARTGFQLALRTGLSFPMGSLSGATNDSLSNTFATQIPLYLDIGVKLTPSFFLGAYTSFAFGATGDAFQAGECPGSVRTCSAAEIRLGAEIQYHFQPGERLNPWIGYGAGIESSGVSATGGGAEASETFTGFELARLSGGLDYRVSRLFGIGPFGDLALGEYTHEHIQAVNGQVLDAGLAQKAFHAWLTLGIRGVLFP